MAEPTVIDLTERLGPDVVEVPDPETVVEWLRTSGGTLRDREMKAAAAALIESCVEVTNAGP